MDIKDYTRKTFAVKAVEMTLENYKDVAEWCGGSVEMVPTRLIAVMTKLPVVKIANNKGQTSDATLGCFVVELKGSFRVYKPAQFNDSFEQKEAEYASYEEVAAAEAHTSDLPIYDGEVSFPADGAVGNLLRVVGGEND